MFPNRVGWKLNESNRQLREFASYSSKPVINLEDDRYHPCQAITDIFTIREKNPAKKRKKVVISWVYHPKPLPQSVTNSITLITTRMGQDVTLACPPGYELADDIMQTAKDNANAAGGSFNVEHDWKTAYQDADVLYIKSWGALKAYGDAREEKKLRMPYRKDWCISNSHLDLTAKDSILMHCLPIRRNVEATDEALDGPHSVIYDQAENRLHTQKALMYYLLKNPFTNEPTFY
jgi:N-acetylornithine carbamoyltransferase